jgi:quinol monooxygenase YgiN
LLSNPASLLERPKYKTTFRKGSTRTNVNISDTEPDTIWVTEVWSNSEAHEASLAQEETKESIQRAMPLIAGVEAIKLRPVGGKGLQFDY